MHSIQFTRESLTPICRSLKNIKNNRPLLRDDDDDYEEKEEACILGDSSTLAFILRHSPKLVEFDQTCEHRVDSSGSYSRCCRDDNRKYIYHSAANSIKATELLYLSQTLNQEDVIVTNLNSSTASLAQIKWSTNSPFQTGTVHILFTTLLMRLFFLKNV